MPAVNACPEQNAYQCLIHGELPPSDVERLSEHLAGCSSCAAAVQTLLGDDTLLSAIRGAPVDAPTGEEVPADLTRRLLALAARGPASTAEFTPLLAPPQGPDEIGRLAHYRVLKVLGEGGMGVVFLAEDVRLSRTVALKTMKPELAAEPRHRQRFLREARAAAKVEHDHIVPIYDVGEERGVPWLAMPFLKGQSLDGLLKRVEVLEPAQAARLAAQVAKGLAAAHAAGLIHRDVKPANIWVEPEGGGRAKLLDFGLAREQRPQRERGEEPLTRSGAVVGTPAFMAPEQARGEPLDGRADLFSLGCVLYRAVTGRLPFQGQGMMATLMALATETPPAPHEVIPAVPRPLSALIMTLLAKDRSARPASASAVAAALEALPEKPTGSVQLALPVAPRQEESSPGAHPTDVAARPAPVVAPRRRWRLATAAVLLLALGGALAVGVVVIIRNRDGKEVGRVTVPDGGSAEIKQDGDKGKPKGNPADVGPDRRAAEWVLSMGANRITIRQDGQRRVIGGEAKDLPATGFVVVSVWFWAAKVDDAGLVHLKDLTNLTDLSLEDTAVSDAGLVHLKDLTNLTNLDLDNTRVSDAGLVHLKGLTRLTHLGLSGTRVSDAGLTQLVNLPLARIDLMDSRVSARGFTTLNSKGVQTTGEPRPSLAEELVAEGATLLIRSGEGKADRLVRTIAGLPREPFLVRRADCTGVRKPLGPLLVRLSHRREYEFERLEALDLSGCAIDDLQFAPPRECLQELNVSGTKVTDLRPLFGLSRLRKLSLDRTPVTSLGPVAEMTDLQELSATGAPITDIALQALENMPNLRKLDLSRTGVTGRGLGYLARLPKLAQLSLAGSKVSDLVAEEVGALTRLEQLSLAGCTFSDAGLKHLAGMSHLTQLDLTGTQVTGDRVADLQQALPKCRILTGPAAR
jgi:Leucine-rich repeat (LRR) protein